MALCLNISSIALAQSPGPQLYSPIENTTVENTTPRLQWESTCDNFQGASCKYWVKVTRVEDGRPFISNIITDNLYDVPYVEGENVKRLEINTQYKWTVTTVYDASENDLNLFLNREFENNGSNILQSHPSEEATFITGGYPWICNENENDDDNFDQDCDGITDIVEDRIGTSKQEKTLFVRPIIEYTDEAGLIKGRYWDEFIQKHFPQPEDSCKNRCIAHIPTFVESGIEIVIIGCHSGPTLPDSCAPNTYPQLYSEFKYFNYDPTNSNPDLSDLPNNKLPCSIMNIVLKHPDSYCDTFCDDTQYRGHTHLSTASIKTIVVTPERTEEIDSYTWTWSTKGFTPSNVMHHNYYIPLIYQYPLDKYLKERAYSALQENQDPVTTNCNILRRNRQCGDCQGDSCFSTMNLNNDDTVEFNPIILNSNGTITDVYATQGQDYSRDEVLKRTIVHEMGHALLGASIGVHCANPNCIMYGSIVDWSLDGFGTSDPTCEPDDAHPYRECCTHKSDVKAHGIILNLSH